MIDMGILIDNDAPFLKSFCCVNNDDFSITRFSSCDFGGVTSLVFKIQSMLSARYLSTYIDDFVKKVKKTLYTEKVTI